MQQHDMQHDDRKQHHLRVRRPVKMLVGILSGAAVALAISGGMKGFAQNVAAVVARLQVGPRIEGTAITSQGWQVTPAGQQITLGDRPYGMTISPDGNTLLVSNDGYGTHSLMVVDRASHNVLQIIPYRSPEGLYIGVVFSPDGQHAYASAGSNNKIRVYDVQSQHLTEREPIMLPTTGAGGKRINPYPAGLAIAPDGQTLYVADNLADALSVVDVAKRTVTATIAVGHNPYGVLLSKDGRTAYVSNWGEQSVSVIDLPSATVRQTVGVGTHPNALALNPQSNEIYVANSDSDSVSVLDGFTSRVSRNIDLAPLDGAPVGSSPNALAIAPDGDTLYVANAGNNDVAVIRLAERPAASAPLSALVQAARNGAGDSILGRIPTAWYPTALTLAADGKTLYVANAKGLGAGPNGGTQKGYIGSMMKGTLSVIPVPDGGQLARYSQQVAINNAPQDRAVAMAQVKDGWAVIPRRAGTHSPIQHVFYIIKENRTYDQILGDLGRGNGDPSLAIFGAAITPNQHQLARQFVTLDNFYADSEVSADGWNWSTAAYANTYVQKNWPQNYSGRNRPYEFEGGNLATSPGRDPQQGYFWDLLETAHISYRNYGWWLDGKVTEPELMRHTDMEFTGWNLRLKDQVRVDQWLKEFRVYEANGQLPSVELLRLPNDHTAGTGANSLTPSAMVADNDLALGRLVEAVSHSRYWATSAIFVVEDDAQSGNDHIDAHRTAAQVISPYTQRGTVDSTFYDTSAMLRTMELIVGAPPMTQFDAAATPMVNAFTNRPNLTPYTARIPAQSLDEKNGPAAPMAAVSAKLDFTREDRVPDALLNEIIWKSLRGSQNVAAVHHTRFNQTRSKARVKPGGDDD